MQLIGAALVLTFLVTELQPLQRIFDTVSLTSSQWDRHIGQRRPALAPAET